MKRNGMICGLVVVLAAAWAQAVPLGSGFTYQGQLEDDGSAADGSYVMSFRLFDAAAGGNQVGSTLTFDGLGGNPAPVSVSDGLFAVNLDFTVGAFSAGQERWLDITVEGTPLSPRQRLAAAPFSLFSAAPWATIGNNLAYVGANVGIGTTTPGNRLSVNGGITVDGAGANIGTVANTLRFGGDTHGEGIGSKKSAGGNQHGIDLYTGHAARMSISNAGNVGIGTSSPATKLHVLDGAIRIGNTADSKNWDFAYDATGDYLYIDEIGAGRRLAIRNGGDVGVGTTAPAARLHVNSPNRVSQVVESADTAGTWLALSNSSTGGRYWQMISTGSGNGEGAGKLLVGNGASAGFTAPVMTVTQTGEVGIGTSFPGAKLDVIGTTRTRVIQITGGSDIAEPFNVNLPGGSHGKKPATAPEPGMVVAIDPEQTGELRLCDRAHDRTVAGIISGAGGVNPGMTLQQEGTLLDGKHPVALTGRVYCFVDADANGPVRPGDLLTTSDTVGHAMRVTDAVAAQGAIIGKAMSSLESGRGLVLVLVSLQ